MSEPHSPYYYIKGGDTYHWEKSCSNNHYHPNNDKWVKVDNKPTGKEQCNECKAK
ncbi:hypothetical protein H3V11_01160 [Snodgrassella sp. W8158]|uniref:hypothetical protein n=1 Tax=Snodgrassella sp. W8158 TaxID=2751018 RepID=UPI0018DE712E|nr:hypothetical protein [Snodgrassella sp. W8158]MBI0180555.1 hypothetical protein [Snodgrassella sp. W8158]